MSPNTYEAVNEHQIGDDYQLPDPENYQSQSGSGSPVTTISRGGGRATVRTNVRLRYNINTYIRGRFSGIIEVGSTMSGSDNNNNGIPDQLEKAFKNRSVQPVP